MKKFGRAKLISLIVEILNIFLNAGEGTKAQKRVQKMLNIRKWVESIQTMYDFQKSPGAPFHLGNAIL